MPKARPQKAAPPVVNPITSGRGASSGRSSTGGGDGGGPLGLPADPTLPPPLPGEISTLHQLLSSKLLSGAGGGESDMPLLVPLATGAVTNMHFDESYGEAQEALIERYLQLMGITGYHQPAQWLTSTLPSPVPPAAPPTHGSAPLHTLPDPSAPPPQPPPFPPLITVSPNLSPGTTRAPTRAASPAPSCPAIPTNPAPTPTPSALVSLGLDRPSLASRSVPDALINALHRGLASNAAAFFRTCLAEQRRLVALAHGSGPAVPLADRVMAFITGVEPQLAAGSVIPDLVDLRTAKDTQTVMDAVAGPRSPFAHPFHHELVVMRQQSVHQTQQQQQQQSKPHLRVESDAVVPFRPATGPAPLEGAAPADHPPSPPLAKKHAGWMQQPQGQRQGTEGGGGEGGVGGREGKGEGGSDDDDLTLKAPLPPGEPDFSHLRDLDKIDVLAHAGNVPGLRALLRGLVDALSYTRTALGGRLAAEGARAQREWSRAEELTGAVSKLREQLAARNSMLAGRGDELEAACRRASAAEEALVTERAKVEGLRGQLRQLTVDFEAQHRQLRTHIAAQATAPVNESALAPGTSQGGSVLQSRPSESSDDACAPHSLAIRLASTRGDLALSEMRAAQEAAGRRQLQVMLQSAQATAELHATRAAAAGEELEHMRRLKTATEDLASVTTGGLAILEQQLAQEKAAHRRTTERLQASAWKYEQARTAVVDIRARAAHSLRRLQTAVADMNLRAVTAERNLGEARMEVMNLTDRLEQSEYTREALRDRLARVDVMLEELRQSGAVREVELQAAQEKLKDVQLELRAAEARVAQMQEKVMADADAVMAGKAASRRLEELQKEHDQLLADHAALTATHGTLVYAHHDLCIELEEARERLADLGVKAEKLEELQTAHEALQEVKSRLETQHAALSKANKAMSSELAGLKRHADVLAEQIQDSRRVAEDASVSLESEKEMHRHTKEELSLISGQRDELEAKCLDMESKMEALQTHAESVDEEVERCRRTAQLAGHQRAEAFAMRDAINKVRMLLACEMKEYISAVDVQSRALTSLVDSLRSVSLPLSSRMLDMGPGEVGESGATLPTIKYEDAKKLWDTAYRIASHGSRLLETQTEARTALVERLDHLEEGAKERLNTATDYWRQVLVLSRGSPRSMIQMVEHMTGQACKELHLDAVNPLGRMVPLGVLQEAGDQLASQFERVGVLRGSAEASRALEEAANKLLEHEREVNTARSSEFQTLVASLSSEVVRLRARVGSLEANNAMQQKATADMQRMLNEAEWKVAKCHEREALAGIRNMVPLGRETRAVQTVVSDLLMMTGGVLYAGALLPASGASAYLHPQPTGALPPSADPANEYDEDFTALEDDVTLGVSSGSQVSVPTLPLPLPPPPPATAPPPLAPVLVLEPPPSPASLPPLSSCSSPIPSRTPISSAGGGPTEASGGAAATTSRDGRSSPITVSSPVGPSPSSTLTSRPPSNLSRSTSTLPPSLGRPGSPDLPSGDIGSGGNTAPGSLAAGTMAAPPTRRRRHPDEVLAQRRSSSTSSHAASISGGIAPLSNTPATVPLSPVASLTSLTSSSSVASESGAAVLPAHTAAGIPLPTVGPPFPSSAIGIVSASANGSFPANSGMAALVAVAAAGAASPKLADSYGHRYVSVSMKDRDTDGGGAEDDESRPWSAGGTRTLGRNPPNPATVTTATTAASYTAASQPQSSITSAQTQSSQTGIPLKSYFSVPSRPTTAIASLPSSHIQQSSRISVSNPNPNPNSGSGSGSGSGSASPPRAPASPATPTGVPHGWQTAPWEWLPEAAPLTRGSALTPFSRQVLLDLLADINTTKSLHDAVAAAADYPPTSLRAYLGAYFEARHGPRGSVPPVAALALAQLLVSLQAHAPLYEVMLFTRLAGLQEWHSAIKSGPHLYRKGSAHSPSRAITRPATAMAAVTSGPPGSTAASPPIAHPSVFARPRTSRAVLYGGGGGLRAAAAANRSLSARAGSSSPAGLSLVPSAVRTSTPPSTGSTHLDSSDGSGGGAAAGGWMTGSLSSTYPNTTLQQLYGGGSGGGGRLTRHRSASSHQNLPRYGSANGGLTVPSSPLHLLLPPPSLPVPPPPKPQLRLVPEAWVPEQLGAMLRRLSNLGGMEALAVYVAAGRLSGRLNGAELGQPLSEAQHPQLHFATQQVVTALGLQELPELLVRDTLPYGTEAMLLQLPCVATSSLEVLCTAPPDKQPAANVTAAATSAPGGCRRRALLLLSPGLVAAAGWLPTPGWMNGSEGGGVSGWSRGSGGGGGSGGGSGGMEDVAAVLGAVLAPMAMPGGYGWRLEVQQPGPGSPPSVGNSGPPTRPVSSGSVSGGTTARSTSSPSPPHGSPRPPAPPAPSPLAPPSLLSAAEVVTAVNVAALRPRAVVGALPSQLQFKWERLLSQLRSAAAVATVAADRGALLATQALRPALGAVWRGAAGAGLGEAVAGSGGEEVLLQAQALPLSEEELQGVASMPLHDAANAGGDTRHTYALARVALLARWAESPEFRHLLRSAIM